MAPVEKQDLGAEWARIRGLLRQEFGEDAFKSWLKPLTFAGASEGEIRITAPTRFLRDWIAAHYAERIHALWLAENPGIRGIVIQVESGRSEQVPALPQSRPATLPSLRRAPSFVRCPAGGR